MENGGRLKWMLGLLALGLSSLFAVGSVDGVTEAAECCVCLSEHDVEGNPLSGKDPQAQSRNNCLTGEKDLMEERDLCVDTAGQSLGSEANDAVNIADIECLKGPCEEICDRAVQAGVSFQTPKTP